MSSLGRKAKKLVKSPLKDLDSLNLESNNQFVSIDSVKKEKSKYKNFKAPLKLTKNILKSSYQKFESASSNSSPTSSKFNKDGVKPNLIRSSLISGPTLNTPLKRNNSKLSGNSGVNNHSLRIQLVAKSIKENLAINSNGKIDRNKAKQLDTEIFFQEEFNPQEYLETLLEGEDWPNPKSLYSTLQDTSTKASLDLQAHVFSNYNQFVSISKEIEKLETGMFELKDTLNELHSMGTKLQNQKLFKNPTENDEPKKDGLSLDETNRKELGKLWKAVQGAIDVLPYVKDRRPLMESPGWKELDNTTYRTKRDGHLFLLTDSILIATKQKRQTIIDMKHNHHLSNLGLMARAAYNFKDLKLMDIKDCNEVKNGLKLLVKNDTLIFMAKSKNDKKLFLRSLTRATQEYFKSLNNQTTVQSKQHKELDDDVKSNDNLTLDQLDLFLSSHQYQPCIDMLILQKEPISSQFQLRKDKLKQMLINRIQNNQSPSKLALYITQLNHLNLSQTAQQTFLLNRILNLSDLTHHLPMLGTPIQYLKDLSQLAFPHWQVTITWYIQLFKKENYMSHLLKFLLDQLDWLILKFFKQIDMTINDNIKEDSLNQAKTILLSHSKSLIPLGIDLNPIIEQLLVKLK